jgi:predicted DNA-binding WGR domain protein
MKRSLINQDKLSNKFWNVEIFGNIQKITFGKIGTVGRETSKEYTSETECIKETTSLIAQKIKKGYVEISENEIIPEKASVSDDEKSEIYFWEAIHKSNKNRNANWNEYDLNEHIESLTELLSKSSKEKLILFEKELLQKLNQLYTAEIAELSIILESEFEKLNDEVEFDDYLSDDGFIYFRCWLLLKGEDVFNKITKDINAYINEKNNAILDDYWGEGLLYVADEAYGMEHENEEDSEIRDAVAEKYPEVIHYDSMDNKMNRDPRGGKELQKMYPNLVKLRVG